MPKNFILQRWSQDARVDSDEDDDIINAGDPLGDTLIGRHSDSSYCVKQLVDVGCMSTKAYHHARKGILQLKKECHQLNECEAIGEKEYSSKGKMVFDRCNTFHRRMLIQWVIRRGLNHLRKNHNEKGCNKQGVSHDRRNCPAIAKRYHR